MIGRYVQCDGCLYREDFGQTVFDANDLRHPVRAATLAATGEKKHFCEICLIALTNGLAKTPFGKDAFKLELSEVVWE